MANDYNPRNHNPLPEAGYVRLAQILGNPKADPPVPPILPICKSSWYAGIKSGIYPAPILISPRTAVYPVEAIRRLIEIQNQG